MNHESSFQKLTPPISTSDAPFTIRFPPYVTPRNSLQGSTSADGSKNDNSRDDFLNYEAKQLQHHTLGQMAEQFQERARAAARSKHSAGGESDDDQNMNMNTGDDSDDEPATNAHGESTGRWTKQEHELFLEALKKYGKVTTPFYFSFLPTYF
jgi:hypothetical protein